MLVDTHCHLDFPEFAADRDEVIKRAREGGIDCIINIGSSLEGSTRSLELAAAYEFIYATVGIHPHQADKVTAQQETTIKELARKEKVVGIGETGLDYYRNFSKVENQKRLFLFLITLAKELGLPLVIHSRQAEEDTLRILRETGPSKAVVHCFSGGESFLKECLDLGFFISFTCNLTYKKAENLRKLVESLPLERLLLETDAPYLPPEDYRGERNEPIHLKELSEELARIKNIDCTEIARITTQNAKGFFGLKV